MRPAEPGAAPLSWPARISSCLSPSLIEFSPLHLILMDFSGPPQRPVLPNKFRAAYAGQSTAGSPPPSGWESPPGMLGAVPPTRGGNRGWRPLARSTGHLLPRGTRFVPPPSSPKEGLVRIILGKEGLFPCLTKGVVHPGSVRMHFGSWSPPLLRRCPVAEPRSAGTVRLASGAGSRRAEQTPPAPARSLFFSMPFFFFFFSLPFFSL